jgi:hypothetical protein
MFFDRAENDPLASQILQRILARSGRNQGPVSNRGNIRRESIQKVKD